MISEDKILKITDIVKQELSEVSILPVNMIQEKAQKIYDKFQIIYQKLENEKLLSEGMNLDIFHQIYLSKLQQAAAAAHVGSMGFFF